MKKALLLFADAPTSELAPKYFGEGFTSEESVSLLSAYYRDVFEAMSEIQEEDDAASLILCYFPADAPEAFEEADLNGCSLLGQRGDTRVDRLSNCFSDLQDLGFQRFTAVVRPSPVIDSDCLEELEEIAAESGRLTIATTDDDLPVIACGELGQALQFKPFLQTLAATESISAGVDTASVTLVSGLPSLDDVINRQELEQRLKGLDGTGYFTRRALKKLRNSV